MLILAAWNYPRRTRNNIAEAPLAAAAPSGSIELLAWLLQLPGTQLSAVFLERAAFTGRTDMCQYLHAQQCPWDAPAPCATAIPAAGHLDLLRWLMDNGCPWEARDLCISAAVGGRIDVLVYLQQKG
jgi:hypothetical protein